MYGSSDSYVYYSDDNGDSWTDTGTVLTYPQLVHFTGNRYGMVEPTIQEMADGRIWMLTRSQTDRLLESWSTDGGETWSRPELAPFYATSSPATQIRMPDGKIVVVWNNIQQPDGVLGDGKSIYTGREVIHIAASDDDGATWKGFRQFYTDRFVYTTAGGGDYGAAYASMDYDPKTDKIVVVTGQSNHEDYPNRKSILMIDPALFDQTLKQDDFTNGLDGWFTWKTDGRNGSRRAYVPGASLVSSSGGDAMYLGKPDDKIADAANWNFPMGSSGSMTLNIVLENNFQGSNISLADRFFTPSEPEIDGYTVGGASVVNPGLGAGGIFRLEIPADGKLGSGVILQKNISYELTFDWHLSKKRGRATVTVNGDSGQRIKLPMLNSYLHGLSYVHIRSVSEVVDTPTLKTGIIVESARIEIEPQPQ